eukprot:TRINITY_DN4149_c0_g1_i1.p1 TRINITY_DN4149_c0_g1~~TRINITY_DN4149_c0_g1_i1.p1  ORF type:complete len:950 (+),score=191.65 TRINITY_DN4149_c0_g1_i1:17-2866(+)
MTSLKDRLFSQLQKIGGSDQASVQSFIASFNQEINAFSTTTCSSHSNLLNKLKTLKNSMDIPQMQNDATFAIREITNLEDNIYDNVQIFIEVKKRICSLTGENFTIDSFMNDLINKYPFTSLSFDDFLIPLGEVFNKINSGNKQNEQKVKSEDDIYDYKFFVKLHDATRVKLEIAKRLQAVQKNQKGDISRRMSCVYFDDKKLNSYHESLLQVNRESGTDSLSSRFRVYWEGQEGSSLCTLERIVNSSIPRKDEIKLKFTDVGSFLKGKFDDSLLIQDNPYKTSSVFRAVQSSAKLLKVKPIFQCQYSRTQFETVDKSVSINFDYDIEFFDETASSSSSGRWCRDCSKSKKSSFRLPFALMHLRVHSVDVPVWLNSLINSRNVYDAVKFSKFEHGIAKFNDKKVRVLPPSFCIPSINEEGFLSQYKYFQTKQFKDLNVVNDQIKKAKTNETISTVSSITTSPATSTSTPTTTTTTTTKDPSRPSVSKDDKKYGSYKPPPLPGHLEEDDDDDEEKPKSKFKGILKRVATIRSNKKLGPPSSGGPLNPILIQIRVEAKTFLANERTVLQWISVALSIVLYAYSVLAIPSSNFKYIGIPLFLLSCLVMFYALWIYHFRRRAVKSRSVDGKYDDALGPTSIVVILMLVIFSILLVRLSPETANLQQPQPPSMTREFRVSLLGGLTTFQPFTQILKALEVRMFETFPQYEIKGELTRLAYDQNISFYDTYQTCLLKNHNIRLKEITYRDPTKNNRLSTASYFEYLSQDTEFLRILDSKFFNSSDLNYKIKENVRYANQITYGREQKGGKLVNIQQNITTVRDLLDYFPLYIYDFTEDELNQPQDAVTLQKVGRLVRGIKAGDVVQRVYGFLDVKFGGSYRSHTRLGRISVNLWLDGNQPIFSELVVSLPMGSYGAPLETLRNMQEFISTLQTFPQFSKSNLDILDYLYTLSFCA